MKKTKEELAETGPVDPRTKLLMLFLLPTVLSAGIPDHVSVLLITAAAIPVAILLIHKAIPAALIYAAAFVGAYLATTYLTPVVTPLLRTLIYTCSGLFVVVLPGAMMGYIIIRHTKTAEINAAMEKIRLTPKISIPIMVVIRFIPTLIKEAASINSAIKMRGIRFGGGKPVKIIEYRMIPLLMSSVKIGDELSMAAITRGMGAPVRRKPVYDISFNAADYILMGAGIFCVVLFIMTKVGAI